MDTEYINDNKHIIITGVFRNRANHESAISELSRAGFSDADISVALPSADEESKLKNIYENETRMPEHIAIGVTAGVMLGGVLGLLAGSGALTILGVGSITAAGPLYGLLAGVIGGGSLGGLIGALTVIGLPGHEYTDRIEDGRQHLSVRCYHEEWKDRADGILRQAGADEISSTIEARLDAYRADDNTWPMAGNFR